MIQIVPATADRAEELFELCAKCFSGGGGYFRMLEHCRGGYWAGSSYDWPVSLMAVDGGRIVSHFGSWKYRMRVGKARLVTAGIGAVMTHGDYRKRGLVRKLWAEFLPAIRRAGYDFTILFGIRDLYHRLDYVQVWPNTSCAVKTESLPAGPGDLKMRVVAPQQVLCDRGAVMRIYNRENATRTGTAERPLYTLAHGLVDKWQCRTLCDAGGRVRGYVVTKADGDELAVLEVGGLGRSCGMARLLAAVRLLARRAGARKVRFADISHDHPVCRALRLGDCSVEMRHSRSGGAMGLVVSLRGCLEAMAGELSDRLARSRMSGFGGTVSIRSADETVSLKLAGGKVRVAPGGGRTSHRILAGPSVARLIVGSESPEVLAEQGQVRFRGDALELAEAMFPPQWPALNNLDRF